MQGASSGSSLLGAISTDSARYARVDTGADRARLPFQSNHAALSGLLLRNLTYHDMEIHHDWGFFTMVT